MLAPLVNDHLCPAVDDQVTADRNHLRRNVRGDHRLGFCGSYVRKRPQTNVANGGRTAGSRQRVAKILKGVKNDG